jgi:hypothetical protein
LRLNARSCFVIVAACFPARSISATSSRSGWPHGELVDDERAVAQDDGEKVVEVVRDAARELADRLHLLGLAELLLGSA